MTEEFEHKIGEYTGAREVVAVNNGTSALMAALVANGARRGSKVLVPDFTHVATANAAKLLGCKVEFVDIDPQTYNVDYELLSRRVKRSRPDIVIVVDVAGLANDFDLLNELSSRYGFKLIEDGAESLGGEYRGKRLGSLDCTTILSFHAAKLVTTVEGGAVLSQDSEVAELCRLFRNHGGASRTYISTAVGINLRTTDIQSAIGLVQLQKLPKYVENRNAIAHRYREALKGMFSFQVIPGYVTVHPYMMFVAEAPTGKFRDGLEGYLNQKGIETRTPFPPLHQQAQFKTAGKSFPESNKLYRRSISLPLSNAMSLSEAQEVISEITYFKTQSIE